MKTKSPRRKIATIRQYPAVYLLSYVHQQASSLCQLSGGNTPKSLPTEFFPATKPPSDNPYEALPCSINCLRMLLKASNAYLLGNHGVVVTVSSAMGVFVLIEEPEESARMAWLLRGTAVGTISDEDAIKAL